MTNPTGPRSEIHIPRNRTTTGVSTESTPVTTSLPLSTTIAQTTAPLTFGSLPPLTRVIATVTDAGTHYSTVTTTTRGGTGDDYVHVTDYDSSESEQERDTPPRRRRDTDHTRHRRRRHRQEANELRGATNQAYKDRIRAYEEEIARLKRDQAILPPPEPRDENPRQTVMNQIHLLPAGDPDNPVPPFTQEIMGARISQKLKLPTIKAYDGTGDPANHVRTFMNALLLQPVTEAIKCRDFPQTLSGMAQHWYSRLPPNSISCFADLSRAFIGQFVGSKTHAKSSASLMNLHQGKNESLREYMNRFTKEALKVPDLDQKVAMIALQQGTTDDNFRRSLAKRSPDNMNDLQERAGKYIKAEESLIKSQSNQGPNTNFKKRGNDAEYNAENKYAKKDDDEKSPAKKKVGPRFTEYARLNAPRSQILMDIEKDESVRWPKPIRTDPEKRNKDLYCRFHKDTGHKTDDCRQLKDEIEFLIRRGKLSKFTKDGDKSYRDNDNRGRDNDDKRTQPRGPVINVISGGPKSAGTSSNSRKAYAREVMSIVGEPPKRAKIDYALAFDNVDLEKVKFPHDEPLVITPVIGNSSVKRVLIDNGASVDILFYDAYEKMGYSDTQLTPSDMLYMASTMWKPRLKA
ncbi:uncharacterized protein LOC135150313 [Daucus carota subsp. sativus]|uniref:uncharacterized protein LOC135150313 n=1 Tax=Daucus carota subsp. sativus TaxID=79200 RepID=UPI0030835D8D